MENSITKPKPKLKKKVEVKTDKTMERIVELNERMNYVVKMLQSHADAINEMKGKLDQVRTRMGL